MAARVIAKWYATELDDAAGGLSELPFVDVENVDPVAARVRAASFLLDEAAAAASDDEATVEVAVMCQARRECVSRHDKTSL